MNYYFIFIKLTNLDNDVICRGFLCYIEELLLHANRTGEEFTVFLAQDMS